MTTDLEINKFLTEEVMGECWHEFIGEKNGMMVCSCKIHFYKTTLKNHIHLLRENPNFLKNERDWYRLLVRAMKANWWENFLIKIPFDSDSKSILELIDFLVTPLDRLPGEIYKFLKETN